MHHKDHHVMCSLLSNVFEAFNDKNLGMCLEEATQFDLDCIFSDIKSIHYILVICHISHIQTFLVVHVQLSTYYCFVLHIRYIAMNFLACAHFHQIYFEAFNEKFLGWRLAVQP